MDLIYVFLLIMLTDSAQILWTLGFLVDVKVRKNKITFLFFIFGIM